VFFLAIGQHIRTVRGTHAASPLAVRTGFGTILQTRIGLLNCRLGLMSERINADDGKCKRQRHHTDSTEHSILHSKLPFLRGWHLVSDRNCRSTQMTEPKKENLCFVGSQFQ
jgi:hypothetical protein